MDIIVCARLKEELKRCEIQHGYAADLCSVTPKTISRWCKNTPISADKLEILVAEGVDPVYMMTGRRSPEEVSPTLEGPVQYAVAEPPPEYAYQGGIREPDKNDPNADCLLMFDILRFVSKKKRYKLMDFAKNLAAEELAQQFNEDQRRQKAATKKKAG